MKALRSTTATASRTTFEHLQQEYAVELGMIGLGRMGANMSERLIEGGHRVVGLDRDAAVLEEASAAGLEPAKSLAELVDRLEPPRTVWLMLPAGDPVQSTLEALLSLLNADDVVVDGGNSYYRDTVRRAATLREAGLAYVDVGTSGGIRGLREGYSLMIGGDDDAIERLRPVFETLAPAADVGWGRVGPSGAGHFVKMVHNGIEYGLMQAYAEGFAMMDRKEDFDLDLRQVAGIWQRGSVVRSWLLDLTAEGLEENPDLSGIAPWVEDSGEGRWAVGEAIDLDVPAPVITLALQARLRSRVEDSFADRLLALMRNQFGGHEVIAAGHSPPDQT